MQIILTIALTLAFGLLQTQCQKSTKTGKPDTAKNNTNVSTTTTPPTATPVVASADDATRISLEDAKKAFDAGNAVIIDTRAEVSYNDEHIKGAINIPAEGFQTRYKEVPKGKKIIAYCS